MYPDGRTNGTIVPHVTGHVPLMDRTRIPRISDKRSEQATFLEKLKFMMEAMMDRNKVADLAKSFSTSCKQIVKDNQLTHKLASPAVMLITLTVLNVLIEGEIDKHIGWGFG